MIYGEKSLRCSACLIIFMLWSAWAYAEVPYITSEMRHADHWINCQPFPDRVVMTPSGTAAFNQGLHAKGLTDDLSVFPSVFSGARLRVEIERLAMSVSMQVLFRRDGSSADADLYAAWTRNMALEVLMEKNRARPAFTVNFTDERLFPTDEPLYVQPGDIYFDQVQNSGLDPATPVMVLHESLDGKWLFIKDGIASGWVKRTNIAFSEIGSWLKAVAGRDMAIVIAARASVYLDETMAAPAAVARMGSHFILKKIKPKAVEVIYPLRHPDGTARFISAFIAPEDIMPGFLPYTPRMVLTQAFKLLDAPYGWGDMNGDQDCSRFIHMVFATIGIDLPRNSGEQGRSGIPLAEFQDGLSAAEKAAKISADAVGGLTLFRLKGHIMLYLGKEDGRLYAIHAIWAYRQKGASGDDVIPLGRVVISDLSLGEGSSKGSLLERIVAVRLLENEVPKDNH